MELDELLKAYENQDRINVWKVSEDEWVSGYVVQVMAKADDPRDPGLVVWTEDDEYLQAPKQWIRT